MDFASGGKVWICCLPVDFRRPCFGDGSSEATDFSILSGARRFHSSPRCKVETVSPQPEVTHSQSLHDDNDDENDDDNSNDNDDEGDKCDDHDNDDDNISTS